MARHRNNNHSWRDGYYILMIGQLISQVLKLDQKPPVTVALLLGAHAGPCFLFGTGGAGRWLERFAAVAVCEAGFLLLILLICELIC